MLQNLQAIPSIPSSVCLSVCVYVCMLSTSVREIIGCASLDRSNNIRPGPAPVSFQTGPSQIALFRKPQALWLSCAERQTHTQTHTYAPTETTTHSQPEQHTYFLLNKPQTHTTVTASTEVKYQKTQQNHRNEMPSVEKNLNRSRKMSSSMRKAGGLVRFLYKKHYINKVL